MNFFDHKDLGNHLLQLCPKVVKHPVYLKYRRDNLDIKPQISQWGSGDWHSEPLEVSNLPKFNTKIQLVAQKECGLYSLKH